MAKYNTNLFFIYIKYLRELVKLLVETGGADVTIADEKGRTASRIAKEMCQIHIMNYLDEK